MGWSILLIVIVLAVPFLLQVCGTFILTILQERKIRKFREKERYESLRIALGSNDYQEIDNWLILHDTEISEKKKKQIVAKRDDLLLLKQKKNEN